MATVYKVWIEVEEYDTDSGKSLGLDLPFASVAVFDKEADARDFANNLNEMGRQNNG